MGKKSKFINDDSDSDAEVSDRDLEEEQELFKNPSRKQKRFTKEQRIYGIWAEEEDDPDNDSKGKGFSKKSGKTRYDVGVSFVKGDITAQSTENKEVDVIDEDVEMKEHSSSSGESDDENDDDQDDESGDESNDEPKERVARDLSDDDEEVTFGGIGLEAAKPSLGGDSLLGGSAFGLGSKNSNVKSSLSNTVPTAESAKTMDELRNMQFSSTSTSFQQQPTTSSKNQPSFNKKGSKVDRAFGTWEKTTKGFGSKYLQQFGWDVGQGLGKDGAGMVKPIDVKLRPSKMGLGHGGFDEQTEAVKEEIRKKAPPTAPAVIEEKPTSGGWRKSKKKAKSVYKTAAEVMREQEEMLKSNHVPKSSTTEKMKIIDMTGRDVKVVEDVSTLKSKQFSILDTSGHFPELRYNLRLLSDIAEGDLTDVHSQLVKEEFNFKEISTEKENLERVIKEERGKIDRVSAIVDVTTQCENLSKSITRSVVITKTLGKHPKSLFAPVDSLFNQMVDNFGKEFADLGLDEVVAATIAPILKALLASWDPLAEPSFLVDCFRDWVRFWRKVEVSTKRLDSRNGNQDQPRFMTPYESVLFNIWMGKIRLCINNTWDPFTPEPLITLLETWTPQKTSSRKALAQSFYMQSNESNQMDLDTNEEDTTNEILPRWLYINIFDQFILPKLTSAIESYSPSVNPPLHTWIFPWLALFEDLQSNLKSNLYATIRQKLSSLIRLCSPTNDLTPSDLLSPWLDTLFTPSEYNNFKQRTLLPRLITILRTLKINPANQEIKPLTFVLKCEPLINRGEMIHLLETEMFTKWHDTLWTWLTNQNADYKEITMWFSIWKGLFPKDLLDPASEGSDEGLDRQFKFALGMMNTAMNWKKSGSKSVPQMPQKLTPTAELFEIKRRANYEADMERKTKNVKMEISGTLTVREILERAVLKFGLVFMDTNRVEVRSGRPIFEIVNDVIVGRRIVQCYVDSKVVYVKIDANWVPKSIMEVIEMAGGNSN
ncbi:hypothetical protein HK098_006207 [Nowakowskiella sp. JEL0407]|nr:hypothetical protein HK098_006207 [Nowakowskiella sp. JEL0407]